MMAASSSSRLFSLRGRLIKSIRCFTHTTNVRVIDMRSDFLTKPTPAMLQAMTTATLDDDVFREDKTVER